MRNNRPKDSGFVYEIVSVHPIGTGVVSHTQRVFFPDESLETVAGNMFATTLKYRCDASGRGHYAVLIQAELSSGVPPGYKETPAKSKAPKYEYVDVGGEVFVVLNSRFGRRLLNSFDLDVKVTCGSRAAITPTPIIPPTSIIPPSGGVTESEAQAIGDLGDLNCPDAKYVSPDRGGVPVGVNKLKDGKCYTASQFSSASERTCAQKYIIIPS